MQTLDELGADLARGYVSVQDRSFRLVAASRSFVDRFGAFEGRHCYEVYKRRSEPCEPCLVDDTFRDGECHHGRELVRTLSGHDVEVLVTTTPLTDRGGRVMAVVEMTTDPAPVRDLRSQVASLGLVIGSVAHGLKSLLTGVDGGLYLVNSGLKKNDEARIGRGLEMVRRNVDRVRTLALDVLYYARDRQAVRETAEVGAVVEEASSAAARRADEHGIELQCEIYPSAGTFEVEAAAVRALVANLLDLAVDACRMDRSRSDHVVRVRADGSTESVHVTVSDSAVAGDPTGHEAAVPPSLWSADGESAALGLFVAHKIARAHGGRIDVSSDKTRGVRFTVILPRRPLPRPT